jgi:hypothetical protein
MQSVLKVMKCLGIHLPCSSGIEEFNKVFPAHPLKGSDLLVGGYTGKLVVGGCFMDRVKVSCIYEIPRQGGIKNRYFQIHTTII